MKPSPIGWPPCMRPFKSGPPENSVGIVIPMKNNLKFFKLAFHSVLSFSDYPYMLTIVDNNSDVPTQTYLRSIQKNHPITVLPYPSEFNYSAEINLGIRYMFSNPGVKYGLVLNSDVVVEPYWLSHLVQVVNSLEKVGIAGPISNMAIPQQQVSRGNAISFTDYVSGFCMIFKREAFEKLNGFDDGYEGGTYEDRDFCYRAKENGWVSVVDCSTYIHHYWKVSRCQDPRTEHHVARNRNRFVSKFPDLVESAV